MKVQQNHQEVLEPMPTLVYSSRNKSALVWPPLYSITSREQPMGGLAQNEGVITF